MPDQWIYATRLARALHGAWLVVLDEELGVVIRWNGSETFNVFGLDGVEVDVFSVDVEKKVEVARQAILDHLATY